MRDFILDIPSLLTLIIACFTLQRVIILERNIGAELDIFQSNIKSRINAFLDVFKRSRDK